jgi:hypothetical protein
MLTLWSYHTRGSHGHLLCVCVWCQVLCLDPPCYVSPTGLVVPIHLDSGGDAASAEARANELPVWRYSDIEPADLREGVADDDDDSGVLDDNITTARRDECYSLLALLEKEKKEWAKLTEPATSAANGATRAKDGKRKRTSDGNSGRAKGALWHSFGCSANVLITQCYAVTHNARRSWTVHFICFCHFFFALLYFLLCTAFSLLQCSATNSD